AIAARLGRTATAIARRDAGDATPDPAAYASADDLERDLLLVREALLAAGATRVERTLLEPLVDEVRLAGLHGFRLDVREDAGVLAAALEDVGRALGAAPLAGEALAAELAGRRPLFGPHLAVAERTREVARTFEAI